MVDRPRSVEDLPRSSPAVVVAVLALCGIVVSLQQTLLLPLLPTLPKLLDTTGDNVTWLVTATLLTGAIATPTVSRLADMYGKRKMMVLALTITVAGSALGAVSQLLPLIIAARALQGVGMALIPVGIAIMRDELPRERLPLGVALMSATLAIGAGCGLPLSGIVSEHLNWHAIFWLTGVVGVVMLAVVLRVLPESPVRTHGTFDIRGALVLTGALTAVLLALSKGAQWGWASAITLSCAALGLVLLGCWVPLELHTPRPLVDLRVASRRPVLLANAASLLVGFAMFANMLVTTQLLQAPKETGFGLGLDALQTGLWMVPNAAAFGLMAPVSAWLIRRRGPAVTLTTGAFVMALSYVGRAFFSDSLWQIVTGSVAVGIGTALVYGAMPTLITRSVPVTETASANGLNVLLRSLGTSTSSATMAAVTTSGAVAIGGDSFPSHSSLLLVFWLAAAASLCAATIGVPLLRLSGLIEETTPPVATGERRSALVIHGRVATAAGKPVRNAVVSVLTADGEAIDWGQADSDGRFTAAIPGPADYLVVTTAEGWRPASQLMWLEEGGDPVTIVLAEKVLMSGVITRAGQPLADALVVLTKPSGETVRTARTDAEGRYELPRPANGRYVLTAVSASGAARSRNATVLEAREISLDLGPET
ncbi:MFS transporter [Nocardioides sp.]|uniref:MFS transporter n=1 Tax=Nocardioides sp. TaxID=35761 RepID=UPI0039E2E373